MDVNIIEEHGYSTALYGFSLSYKDRAVKPNDWWNLECPTCIDLEIDFGSGHPGDICVECRSSGIKATTSNKERADRIAKTAQANAKRGKGHNKFLRQVILWVDIEAPRYFWSEFDTYKVGTVAQSESTMHTLSRRDVTVDDFQETVDGYHPSKDDLLWINDCVDSGRIQRMKGVLPESYLQRRLVTMNYAVLRTIIEQRKNHRLPEWATFIESVMGQVEHPEYLEDLR